MSAFGLPTSHVAALVDGVRAEVDDLASAFARAAWSTIAEPGDRVAGTAIAALGADGALETLLAADRTRLVRAIADGEETSAAEREADLALARWRPRLVSAWVARALEAAARRGVGLLLPGDEDWPSGFADLGASAPVALWWMGSSSALAAPAIAVVGARASTGYGEHVAAELASGVAERGLAVTSGGAYGIDAAAHRAALAVDGSSVAYLAGGLDRFYPAGNAQLLARVAAAGAVAAEVPCGVAPTKFRFLARNRLLAASARATLVVEAGRRSGSLNTAHHTLAIGRPLGVVPGPITSPASAGCHRLLRESDAMCVTCVDDVAELAGEPRRDAPPPQDALGRDELRVLDELGVRRGRPVDAIARSSGLTVPETLGVLGRLGVDGRVRQVNDGWVRVPGRVTGER